MNENLKEKAIDGHPALSKTFFSRSFQENLCEILDQRAHLDGGHP